jgi:hypothetical protein
MPVPISGNRHQVFDTLIRFKKFVILIAIRLRWLGSNYSPFPRTPATIPIMNTAARTNRPRARKLNAVPVLVRTFVNEVDRTEVVIEGMDASMFATTTSPTIIVTAAITTVRMRETISIPPSTFLNIFSRTPPLAMMYIPSIYKGDGKYIYY